jgi:hypothetical protein
MDKVSLKQFPFCASAKKVPPDNPLKFVPLPKEIPPSMEYCNPLGADDNTILPLGLAQSLLSLKETICNTGLGTTSINHCMVSLQMPCVAISVMRVSFSALIEMVLLCSVGLQV